jgi:hypothetical protein
MYWQYIDVRIHNLLSCLGQILQMTLIARIFGKSKIALTEPWGRVIEYWDKSGLSIRPSASVAKISEFETKFGVILPHDFKKYLQIVDGSSEGKMDDGLYRFWPLTEIRPVHEELDESRGVIYGDRFAYPDCFVFADHCISCWLYAIRITKDPAEPAPVFRVTAGKIPGEQMAPSFLEFMTRYANDPGSIL